MRTISRNWIHQRNRIAHLAAVLTVSFGLTGMAQAQDFGEAAAPTGRLLDRDQAVHLALQQNPMLMTARKSLGFAEGAIVIAKTYPFNPSYVGYVTPVGGPNSANITNRVQTENYVTLELELRGQGRIRRETADATKARIEADISRQELAVTIAVIRAYNAVLYRQKKLELLEEGIKVNKTQVEKLQELAQMKKAKETDLMLARADLAGAAAQLGQARTTLSSARSDLRRLLGTVDEAFDVAGDIDVPLPTTDKKALTQLALNLRPDLQARRAAIAEAEGALKLIEANKYGNISAGPFFEYDPGRIYYIGGRVGIPLAIFNKKKGEIMNARNEVARVQCEVKQIEVQVSQDVAAALARLAEASKWARSYYVDVLPDLTNTKLTMEKMFAGKDADVDLPRYLTVQRAFLKATENFLDARYEVSQAESDLAAAVAEPALALGAVAGHVANSTPVVRER